MHPFISFDKFGLKIKTNKYFAPSKTDIFIGHNFKELNSCSSFLGFAYRLPHGMEFDLKKGETYLAGSNNFAITRLELYLVQDVS